MYLAHVASADAVAIARDAQDRGVRVSVETRPNYLWFTNDRFADADGALYVGNPPLRSARDVDAMWTGLRTGAIQTLASDHAPWTREEKLDPTRTIADLRPGMPDLETMLPLLFSDGVLMGRLSLERFVEVTSTNAARLFGLYPAKGTIGVGGDADLVLWDPTAVRTIRASEGASKAGFSLHEGRRVTGWPRYTISRGRVVVADGRVVDGAGAHGREAWRRPVDLGREMLAACHPEEGVA
jgi:dihydropyrimidinase